MTLSANPVVWFEIPVVKLDRAKAFYEGIFGTKLELSEMGPTKMAMFPMEMNQPGSAGTLLASDGRKPSKEGLMVYLHVPAIDDVLGRVEKHGGKVVLPRTNIGPHGFMAHIIDTEGNGVGIHESPE